MGSKKTLAQTKSVEKSIVWKRVKLPIIQGANAKSPPQLISIALIDDLLASSHVSQKLTNKYEERPKNNWRKLSPVTNINIKKVKMDK